jgi:hypothetical protein
MSWHEFWILVHVLLFVYWLGADLGVLLLAKRARDPALELGQRTLLLEMAMKLDFTPRVAFVLMLPVGVQMAWNLGLFPAAPWVPVTAWSLAAAWLVLVIQLARSGGSSQRLHRLQTAWLLTLGIALAVIASLPWWTSGFAWPAGLSAKLGLYAVICLLALGIDWAFRPVASGFGMLASGQPKAEAERLIGTGIDVTLRFVVSLYMALLAAAFMGIMKPDF